MNASFFQALWEPLQHTFFQKALIGSSLVAIVSGVVGCLVVLRRMAFLGDALSHAMIAGVAGGYLFMKVLFQVEAYAPAMLLGSLIAALVTVMLIGFVARVSRVKEDAAIGIMYTGVFAAGVVLVSIFRNYIHIDLMHFIMGDVLAVANDDLWASAVTAIVVLSVIVLFFRYFQITSFDPAMAASIGIPVLLIDYVFTACVSLVVVSAVTMVGVILVIGLLITPAATAYLLSDRLDRMMLLSALFGVTSVVGGLYLCILLDSSGGGAIVLFCTLQFLAALVAAPKYGILARRRRLRRMVPQQLMEDILGAILRAEGAPMTPERIAAFTADPGRLGAAMKTLTADGLVREAEGDGFALTEKGRKEALRILRAHRLWETYLQQRVGTPAGEVHAQAHHLEHVRDEGAVEYLDDLLLHPTVDPHGSEIPQDPAILAPGSVFPLSLLRPNMDAIVEAPQPGGFARKDDSPPLRTGERIRVAPRPAGGSEWIVLREDGSRIALGHEAADAVKVRVAE
ncbi:MAG: iron chelate uptake ABC transporter family permease subunit [Syntrophobacteraceae bacterium]